ncbi:unnamed protein product [Nezara viridula]|uniref:Uncharacterized protein n=1 Tax=Nezara viridula TaxID=85310 RepID=A0A9P0E190_NEZVI|nr:unnamed protein product [Nezara viridula]
MVQVGDCGWHWASEVMIYCTPPSSPNLTNNPRVTGAGRGLGREICLRLIKEGVKLTCVDVSLSTAEETAALCNATRPGSATAAYCDIADKQQVSKLVEQVPPVDILINNAGIVSSASILEVTDEHIERLMQVNILSQFWVSFSYQYSFYLNQCRDIKKNV